MLPVLVPTWMWLATRRLIYSFVLLSFLVTVIKLAPKNQFIESKLHFILLFERLPSILVLNWGGLLILLMMQETDTKQKWKNGPSHRQMFIMTCFLLLGLKFYFLKAFQLCWGQIVQTHETMGSVSHALYFVLLLKRQHVKNPRMGKKLVILLYHFVLCFMVERVSEVFKSFFLSVDPNSWCPWEFRDENNFMNDNS